MIIVINDTKLHRPAVINQNRCTKIVDINYIKYTRIIVITDKESAVITDRERSVISDPIISNGEKPWNIMIGLVSLYFHSITLYE